MVEHEKIDPAKTLHKYICNKEKHSEWAKKCSKLLDKMHLRAYCYQYPSNKSYTCWYVGFADQQNPYIMHFNITKNGLKVWFRRPEYLSDEGKRQTVPDQNFRCSSTLELNNNIRRIIADYVREIGPHLLRGEVKLGRIHKNCQAEPT